MRVRFAVPLVLLLAALLPSAAAAVPCPPLQCGPTTAAVADGRLLAVGTGPGRTASIYDASTGKLRVVVPNGLVSADGRRAAGQEGRQLRLYDLGRLKVDRRDALGAGWSLAGLSADGRRAVVVRRTGNARTGFAVRGAQPASISLDGKFEFDGLLGNRLYVIEQRANGYLVRVADLSTGLLDAEPLKDADEPALIQGFAWSRLASPDGRYVFTLYIEDKGKVMIHELDMRAGTARCIDLPGNGDFMASGSYALALSRDGRTLYAASGANGTVVTVDVAAQKVISVAHVPKVAVVAGSSGLVLPSAALSRDGKRLAFALNGTMWIYDLAAGGLVRKWTSVVGAIAYSRSGVLWVVGTDGLARRAAA